MSRLWAFGDGWHGGKGLGESIGLLNRASTMDVTGGPYMCS